MLKKAALKRTAIHPGQPLREQLEALEMSAAELGRQLGVPTNRITEILNGDRSITGDTALRLGHFFKTEPEFWMNLQMTYELRMAAQKAGKSIQVRATLTGRKRKLTGSSRSRAT